MGASVLTFPLCQNCADSLIPCPPICSRCGGLGCSENCARPWVTNHPIATFTALYLLVGQGYTVLRRWKGLRRPLFDRRVLKSNGSLCERWSMRNSAAIIPIPQLRSRTWKLGGSSAEAVADFLSNEFNLPMIKALQSSQEYIHHHRRQGELSRMERLQNPIRFEIDKKKLNSIQGRPVCLVDDFMTTGHTLRRAAEVLAAHGVGPIHVYCLGLRPPMTVGSPVTQKRLKG